MRCHCVFLRIALEFNFLGPAGLFILPLISRAADRFLTPRSFDKTRGGQRCWETLSIHFSGRPHPSF
jgi:hypothetical protein